MEAKDAEAKKEKISLKDVEKVRIKKKELRGGFSSKILLKKVLSSK